MSELQSLIGPDYKLQWVIGEGGMSTVWLADDVHHDREVAIKVLRPEFSDNNEFLSRFRNEALASENIISENVVQTYDYRELTDHTGRTLCFIVMEYVRGESLADMLARKGGLPEELALDVMEQAAHGLSIIHRMGLVHRDIKPGNLLITQDGKVKITDFGIAKAAAAVPLTRTGMVVGTAQYVSPEQAQGREVTAASDVYSLGVVGYEMLAGKRPFIGDSSVSVAIAHINQAPPALPTTITAQARELIGIALRKDPTARYADGNELALAVSAVRLGQRPPQPKTAQLQHIAPTPSPSASTHALGRTAKPAPEKQGGMGWGFVVAGAIAALIAAGIWATSQGLFEKETPKLTPQIATITETITQEQPTPEPTPEPTTPTPTPTPTPSPTPSPEPSPTPTPTPVETEEEEEAVETETLLPIPSFELPTIPLDLPEDEGGTP